MIRNLMLAAAMFCCACGAGDGMGTNNVKRAPGIPALGGTGALKPATGGVGATTSGTAGLPGMQQGPVTPRQGGGAGMGPLMMNATAGRPGTAGTGPMMAAAGMPAMGAAGMPAKIMTTKDPVIPEVKGECPNLESGAINFMGADGQVEAGPKPASPTAPMLLYWHGTGSTAGEYAFMAGAIAQGVTSEGGIVVSFQGTTNKGDCSPSGTFIFCTGDFDVMDQYVACAVKNRNVDPRRIYTAGCSAGGLMATAMAAQRSQYIAAAAPNSGGMTFPSQFSSMHTPPLMAIHGAPGSDVVGVDFSQTSATACMAWKQRGGFSMDCNTGGSHCGGGGLAGDAWKFFKAHPFGIDPEPWTTLPAGFTTQCKIQ